MSTKYCYFLNPGDLASQDCLLGMEFSGRTSVGKRVMGLLPAKVRTEFQVFMKAIVICK